MRPLPDPERTLEVLEGLQPGGAFTSGPQEIDAWTDDEWQVVAADRQATVDVEGRPIEIASALRVRVGDEESVIDVANLLREADDGRFWEVGSGGVTRAGRVIQGHIPQQPGLGAIVDRRFSVPHLPRLGGRIVMVSGRLFQPASWLRFGSSEIPLDRDRSKDCFFSISTIVDRVPIRGEASNGWTFEVTFADFDLV